MIGFALLALLQAAPVAAVGGPVSAAGPAIDEANAEWARAIRTGDADALSRPYAEDAVFVLPDGDTVRGHAAIRAMYAGRRLPAGVAVVDAGIESAGRVAADADDVYEWGSAWTLVRGPDGRTTRRGGRFVTVWHRQADGGWRIVRNLAF